MARIALKIDVDTLRGTREGVPHLARILERYQAQATFLFSLGPDHTGWALKRIFRPGFLKKVSRTSVIEHYGLKTLMYGVLLPGPDIGKKAQAEMLAVARAGFECGIHTWDHVLWHDTVRHRDETWTRLHMQHAWQRFGDIFGVPPTTHGAAGWQMNATAFAQLDEWGMFYASDGRGTQPYHLHLNQHRFQHIQCPTTLPTLDELLGREGLNESNVAAAILAQTTSDVDQVFTLHAELEGQKLSPIFVQLLQGWLAQGHQLVNLAQYYAGLDTRTLPQLPIEWGSVPGRSGELIVQPVIRA